MSTTVKVFIVLNLLLALAFMFVQMTVYATRENWKRRWNDDTKFYIEEVKVAAQKLSDESFAKVQAQTLVNTQATQINDLQAAIKKEVNTIAEKDKEIQSHKLTISKNDEDIKAQREQIQTLSQTLETTRQQNSEKTHIAQVALATTYRLNQHLAVLEDDYNNATTALDQREEDLNAAKKVINRQNAQLAILKGKYPQIAAEILDDKQAAFIPEAVVASIGNNPQGQQDFVVLTIGNAENVPLNAKFTISRGNQFIVNVYVESVQKGMAICKVDQTSWNMNQLKIQLNDRAANFLY